MNYIYSKEIEATCSFFREICASQSSGAHWKGAELFSGWNERVALIHLLYTAHKSLLARLHVSSIEALRLIRH